MKSKKKYRKQPLIECNRARLEYISGLFREYRLWTGHSRESIAEENNLNRSFFECAESPNNNPTLKSIFLLCDVYEITPEELFKGLE